MAATNRNKKCQCFVTTDHRSGVLRAVTKCQHHVMALMREFASEEEHYQGLGTLQHPQVYLDQWDDAFGVSQPARVENKPATLLEIGAGCSPYVGQFLDRGYEYVPIDPSAYVSKWFQDQGVQALRTPWEELHVTHPVSCIVAAHSVEHMPDAPYGLQKMFNTLRPGGSLFLILPNDEDLCNPDHWWFFSEQTLMQVLSRIGFETKIMTSRRYIERESFIYCHAVRPLDATNARGPGSGPFKKLPRL